MTNFEGSDFENLDPSDFGEPTLETRARLENALASLNSLTNGATYEISDIIHDTELVDEAGVSINDLCPVTQYYYDQLSDPLFAVDEETYLKFDILDGNPEKFMNWAKVVGNRALMSVYYQDAEIDINYNKSFHGEELYITTPPDSSIGMESDEYLPMMLGRIKNYMQALKNGATRPTEGAVKKLAEKLEQEIAKRIVE